MRASASEPLCLASASASDSATNSSGTTAGTTPRCFNASAVTLPIAATAVVANTRGVRPQATSRSNTICTVFWLVNTTHRYAERPVNAARNAPRFSSG